ncbi:GNAT family N-acetyltransferase [Celeribacter sp.]|uniref:GNAT family N-acetyltransferase n=1 Tax=Celeribacter sp. TaxID=1890673 RepID=UPI003A8D94A9
MISDDTLWAVLEATWPPVSCERFGPFVWREGAGGGQRVSAASASAPVSEDQLDLIEARFNSLGRDPLFQVRDNSVAFDRLLDERGYDVVDPTILMLSSIDRFPMEVPDKVYTSWPPVAVQREIWAEGDVDAARVAVMERVSCAKTSLLARLGDAPAGAGFVAVSNRIAVVHALEVNVSARRHGVARAMLALAAYWAREQDATHLALQVTQANAAAASLYSSLGMKAVGQYHYRKRSSPPRET